MLQLHYTELLLKIAPEDCWPICYIFVKDRIVVGHISEDCWTKLDCIPEPDCISVERLSEFRRLGRLLVCIPEPDCILKRGGQNSEDFVSSEIRGSVVVLKIVVLDLP